ncbi:methylated-DNA--[protein]-cysteine S-methyltransferase [bacterium]|nr:methylated-DNA--[protein]-cysteine S-methyltransferase [bacterium]MCB2179304.1 methylated-DNA--[protein]-cysteine S-methyltransferase [bacterium]
MNQENEKFHQYSTLPDSPLGRLWALADGEKIRLFEYGVEAEIFRQHCAAHLHPGETPEESEPHPVLEQVRTYLNGQQRYIEAPLDWTQFTPFQTAVYRAVLAIPYGETKTYGQVAAEIGRPRAARAVGAANGANPLPLIIPCHRLVGADGSLRGYGGVGGLKTKRWLLDLEKAHKEH